MHEGYDNCAVASSHTDADIMKRTHLHFHDQLPDLLLNLTQLTCHRQRLKVSLGSQEPIRRGHYTVDVFEIQGTKILVECLQVCVCLQYSHKGS